MLFLNASLNQYLKLAEQSENPRIKIYYRHIAETISEIGPYIRFIAVALNTKSDLRVVSTPSLATTSDSVERALADCEHLIHNRGATSGVDRIHTVFHGYLRAVCAKYTLEVPQNAGVTHVFKALRDHPGFLKACPKSKDIDRVINAMAQIVDALNPLRNQATLAHPNDALLEESEAMLVINSVRTLLHYLNNKTG